MLARTYTERVPLAIFDLDGTLVDQAAAAKTWAERFAAECQLSASDADVIADALTSRRPKGEVFAELVTRLELSDAPSDLWATYREQMPTLVHCDESTKDALERMRTSGWTIGIATNGEADNQVAQIRNTGLSQLVDGWVVSSKIGIRKPGLGIFQALAAQVQHPLNGWMIGDSLEHDVRGGTNAGLKTAWITNGTESRKSHDPTPTLIAPNVAVAVDRILVQ